MLLGGRKSRRSPVDGHRVFPPHENITTIERILPERFRRSYSKEESWRVSSHPVVAKNLPAQNAPPANEQRDASWCSSRRAKERGCITAMRHVKPGKPTGRIFSETSSI